MGVSMDDVLKVLEEFVTDVESLDNGVSDIEEGGKGIYIGWSSTEAVWPDLAVTYHHAVDLLMRAGWRQ